MGFLGQLGRVIKSIPAPAQGPRTLRQGMNGLDVARCQNQLNAHLPNSPPPL